MSGTAPLDGVVAGATRRGPGVLRWVAFVLLGLVVLVGGAVAAAWFGLGRVDLAPLVAGRLGAALGRPATIARLHLTPGRWLKLDLRGVTLANIAGGSRPSMLELAAATAEIDALSLLRPPVVVRHLTVDGLTLVLERTADRTGNWALGPARTAAPAPAPVAPADRHWFPTLLDVRATGLDIRYRMPRGTEYGARLDAVSLATAGADQPVRLTATGAYNAVPVALSADLQPIAVLRDANTPYGVDLHAESGGATLGFQGTMTEPFDVDGARGTLTLATPSPAPLLAFAALTTDVTVPVSLSGGFERDGDLWRLADATGSVAGAPVKASLRFVEGGRGAPDDLDADVALDRLDLNPLLASGGERSSQADLPLDVDRAPDLLFAARIAARDLRYRDFRFADAKLDAARSPGRVAVKALELTFLGARFKASGQVEAADHGGRVSLDVDVSGADVQQTRAALGFGAVPVTGRLSARALASSAGATLNAATSAARVSAAVAMTGGSISRAVIEMASTDVRLLFRKAKGMVPVSCLLGVLDMRAGVGTVQPLRVRASTGTIAGSARFDLNRGWFDLTIGSQASTTGAFALDVPVRASGAFANPTVRPARWSAAGRAALAAADDIGRLPPGLQPFVRANPCARGGR